MKNRLAYMLLIPVLGIVFSCGKTPTPKPTGYFRIDFSEKEYKNYQANCGFSFETPVYSEIEKFKGEGIDTCWFNISYPDYKAKVHITYLPIQDNLGAYLEDAHQFAFKHESKASAIDASRIDRPEDHVGCLVYDLKGDVATSLQFYITDSTNHFLRGSLYFSHIPNEDSIAPVLNYLREDVVHLINTISWDEN